MSVTDEAGQTPQKSVRQMPNQQKLDLDGVCSIRINN
jgi:hypothetical protein